MPKRALCWIRRDLRLSDHAPLAIATAEAEAVAVVFVFDTNILSELEDRDDRRVSFILKSLEEVDSGLRVYGSRLIVLHGDPTVEIPRIVEELGADTVYCGRDYEPYAQERDQQVSEKVNLRTVKDHVIFEPHEITNQAGQPFKVFTPFRKAWESTFESAMAAEHVANMASLLPASTLENVGNDLTFESMGFVENSLWLAPGEQAAKARLASFLSKIDDYGTARDLFGTDGTSGLSAHLRFGTISVRECCRAVLTAGSNGAEKWKSELIWREFYQMILGQFPHVVETTFNPLYQSLRWPGTDEDYAAWERGATGYPIVDAAMRCLNATGWMHNRLRMVVASFLTKDLLVDYKRGEAHFARKLLDFDLAQNNGGWQWAASTGVDAQPYFRIFNPVLQSKRFDPTGSFVRVWCKELEGFDDDRIHWPHDATAIEQLAAGCVLGEQYPHPIVDHQQQKALAVALLSSPAAD